MRLTGRQHLIALCLLAVACAAPAAPPFFDEWETFGVRDGLPSDKALAVLATETEVWVGTDEGLARLKNGRWKTFTAKDGLAHRAVLFMAEDPDSGDLWIATMGGLSRYSGGRFDTFTQLNSGLANDVVYGVAVEDGEVWAATAAGASRYDIRRNRWTIFDDSNTPMHEIWCYSVTIAGNKVYMAVWGGGLLEYERDRNHWKDYRDPDGEMEIDLFRNDGLVHDVVTAAAPDAAHRIWIGTYFGLSSYDGRKWRNFMDHDSPLLSNFINAVTTKGTFAWLATDNGVSATDRENWWSYQRDAATGEGLVIWTPADGPAERFATKTMFPHNYILALSFQGDEIWVATEKGVARGRRSSGQASRTTKRPAAEPNPAKD